MQHLAKSPLECSSDSSSWSLSFSLSAIHPKQRNPRSLATFQEASSKIVVMLVQAPQIGNAHLYSAGPTSPSKYAWWWQEPSSLEPIHWAVDRTPTHLCFSDTCYNGLIGAFSINRFQEDLIQYSFDMKSIDKDTQEPNGTTDGLHINVLEFITMIIELLFVIVIIKWKGSYPAHQWQHDRDL